MLVDLLATAVLAVVPFLVGVAIGRALPRLSGPLLVATGVPAAYFTVNLLVALERQRLRETLVVGVPLGSSPVFIMLLTAVTGGLSVGLAAGSLSRGRLETFREIDA